MPKLSLLLAAGRIWAKGTTQLLTEAMRVAVLKRPECLCVLMKHEYVTYVRLLVEFSVKGTTLCSWLGPWLCAIIHSTLQPLLCNVHPHDPWSIVLSLKRSSFSSSGFRKLAVKSNVHHIWLFLGHLCRIHRLELICPNGPLIQHAELMRFKLVLLFPVFLPQGSAASRRILRQDK